MLMGMGHVERMLYDAFKGLNYISYFMWILWGAPNGSECVGFFFVTVGKFLSYVTRIIVDFKGLS